MKISFLRHNVLIFLCYSPNGNIRRRGRCCTKYSILTLLSGWKQLWAPTHEQIFQSKLSAWEEKLSFGRGNFHDQFDPIWQHRCCDERLSDGWSLSPGIETEFAWIYSKVFFEYYILYHNSYYRSFRKYCWELLNQLVWYSSRGFYQTYKIYISDKIRAPCGRVNIPLAFQSNGLKELREILLKNLTVLHNIYETYCSETVKTQ